MSAAKILLIEDDSGIADTLRRVLMEEGHEVATCQRGDDGLALAVANSFNVVITDLKLPGLNGLELVQRLRDSQTAFAYHSGHRLWHHGNRHRGNEAGSVRLPAQAF